MNSEASKKIQSIAESLGYKPNPLVSAVMSRNRSSRNRLAYNGNLAIISAYRDDKKPLPFHDEIIRAAQQRATELSFHVDPLYGYFKPMPPAEELYAENRSLQFHPQSMPTTAPFLLGTLPE